MTKTKKIIIMILALLIIIALIAIPVFAKSSKPATPKSFKVQQIDKTIKITWKKGSSKKVKGYQIYQKQNGKYKLIKTTTKTSISISKNLKNNTTYKFKVRSYNIKSGKKITSKFTSVKSVKYKIKSATKTDTEPTQPSNDTSDDTHQQQSDADLADLVFDGTHPYVIVNNNIPVFTSEEISTTSYETYGDLDSLGRCTTCIASIGTDLMPTEERGSIGNIKPTGWQTIKFDFVDGKYLYNRCHLIGYQLTAENANPQNLITGTRYLNIDGMLDFENQTANYIRNTKNHVIYKVTPVFKNNELLARGVHMQAMSIEDNGKGLSFNIYAFNAQPGVTIDYQTGSAYANNEQTEPTSDNANITYYINKSSKKIHIESCQYSSAQNVVTTTKTMQELLNEGYEPCKVCNPK